MLDQKAILEQRIEHHRKSVDIPYYVNGFGGTWQISDHRLIPECLEEFLSLSFGTTRLERVEIEEINRLLNEVWEGPGSMEKILRMEFELRGRVNMNVIDMPRKTPIVIDADDVPLADRSDRDDDSVFFLK